MNEYKKYLKEYKEALSKEYEKRGIKSEIDLDNYQLEAILQDFYNRSMPDFDEDRRMTSFN